MGIGNDFFGLDTKSKGKTNTTKPQVGLYHTKKHLLSKENHQQNGKATYVMGKNICKPHI